MCSVFFQVLSNTLWYLTNQHAVIKEASFHDSKVRPVPDIFHNYQGFNEMRRKKLKEMPLSARNLKSHCEALLSLCIRPCVAKLDLKQDIMDLHTCLDSYINYLNQKNESVSRNHRLNHPVREVSKNVTVEFREANAVVAQQYNNINDILKQKSLWEPVQVKETLNMQSSMQRLRFIEHLHVSEDTFLLRYSPGGGTLTLCYVWKGHQGDYSNNARVIADLKTKLPVYHTREMKRTWQAKYAAKYFIECETSHITITVFRRRTAHTSIIAHPQTLENLDFFALYI